MTAAAAIEAALERRPRRLTPLTGGCIAEVYLVELEDHWIYSICIIEGGPDHMKCPLSGKKNFHTPAPRN